MGLFTHLMKLVASLCCALYSSVLPGMLCFPTTPIDSVVVEPFLFDWPRLKTHPYIGDDIARLHFRIVQRWTLTVVRIFQVASQDCVETQLCLCDMRLVTEAIEDYFGRCLKCQVDYALPAAVVTGG